MSNITYLKLSGKTEKFKLGNKTIECRPAYAKQACVVQDSFDTLQECSICGKTF